MFGICFFFEKSFPSHKPQRRGGAKMNSKQNFEVIPCALAPLRLRTELEIFYQIAQGVWMPDVNVRHLLLDQRFILYHLWTTIYFRNENKPQIRPVNFYHWDKLGIDFLLWRNSTCISPGAAFAALVVEPPCHARLPAPVSFRVTGSCPMHGCDPEFHKKFIGIFRMGTAAIDRCNWMLPAVHAVFCFFFQKY